MDKAKQIENEILRKISGFEATIDKHVIGRIIKLADGVALISGLDHISYNEMVQFPHNILGVAINLEEHRVGTIILGDYELLTEGDEVAATGKLLSIPVGEALIGRVIDPLGNPLDGKGEIKVKQYQPIEKIAPDVTKRQRVDMPLQTGIKAIDAIIPIGRGQRELIIGDRGIGKTALVTDTIINQKGENVTCIYVAIGQKASRVAQLINALEKHQAMEHTIIVAANAADPVSLQYLAPYAGSAIGEYFLNKGQDALVVYDDLTKHAWAYRQISLVLKRPSGREAYPGDVFYLHSRLLERACRLDKKYGGGSLTALPIIETQAQDLSAYIPTNVISITDGQIFLEPDLFYSGIRPAISVGLSVSRVGGAAQIKAMKQVAGQLRLSLAQYRDLAAFTQFASDLDATTKAQIDRGARMTEILKQSQWQPMPVVDQVISIWTGVRGYLDDVDKSKINQFIKEFISFVKTQNPGLVSKLKSDKLLSEETEIKLKQLIGEFKGHVFI